MDPEPQQQITVNQCIDQIAKKLDAANLHFGHGAIDAQSEALWLVSKQLDISHTEALDHLEDAISEDQIQKAIAVADTRISTRKPLAYILGEAWLMGVPFFVASKVLCRALGLQSSLLMVR